MRNFKNLEIWNHGIQIVKQVYKLSQKFPADEKFGLISQISRAAVSIPSNIAEGFERETTKEFIRFLYIAKASSGEFRSQLYLAFDLDYMTKDEFSKLNLKVNEVSKLISGLIIYLNSTL